MVDQTNKLTIKEIVIRGTIIAIMVSLPSLTAFFLSWMLLDNLLLSAIVGGIVHFIAMGFSLKISKKFFTKQFH